VNLLRKTLDGWLGRGEASITTPPMDGAFRPNDLLDAASAILHTSAPDDLAMTSMGMVVSSGRSLLRVDKPGDAPAASFDVEISALAGLPDGGAAVGLVDGRIVFVGGGYEGNAIAADADIGCITALTAARDGTLLVANGSASRGPSDWKRDLMEKNASGSVWRLEPESGARTQLAANLAYPNGLLEDGDAVVVSESWRCALTRVTHNAGRRSAPVLEDLPAYPSRLTRGAGDAIWLSLFAPRSQLVEFVLSEDRYRRRMIDEIDADHWVAPCLRSGLSQLEPTQQGGVKQLGVMKPWSPSRSYGLIAHLDRAYRPIGSLHSRTNGRRHGVTSCLESEGRLYFTAKGDGIVASCSYEGLMP
jgi:hypothetical protein